VTKKQYDAVVYCAPIPCIVNRKSRKIPLVYDCLDQWDGFPNAHPRTLEFEDSLAQVADIIWGVTPELVDRLSNRHGAEKCHLVPNGCDYDHFSSPKKVRRPAQWKPNAPVIGYAGVVSDWFDWNAVLAIAKALPEGIVWIIGSCNATVPQRLPSNVVLEGFVPYEELPPYYAGFDVSIIPFKGDVLLKGVSPIKLYEYIAAGKPVVSSKMADAMELASPGIVEVAKAPNEFAQICSRLMNSSTDETLILKRQALAQSHSWASRWGICESMIRSFKR
jgi:glycosyltransferase involved in cell wall biosynthesis